MRNVSKKFFNWFFLIIFYFILFNFFLQAIDENRMLRITSRLNRIVVILKVMKTNYDTCWINHIRKHLITIVSQFLEHRYVFLLTILIFVFFPQLLADQIVILETMAPLDFMEFRYVFEINFRWTFFFITHHRFFFIL